MICFIILLLWACGVWNIPHPDVLCFMAFFEAGAELAYFIFTKEFK